MTENRSAPSRAVCTKKGDGKITPENETMCVCVSVYVCECVRVCECE